MFEKHYGDGLDSPAGPHYYKSNTPVEPMQKIILVPHGYDDSCKKTISYKVVETQNILHVEVGSILPKDRVKSLVDNPRFTVIIRETY
jgi:hypothetical protein